MYICTFRIPNHTIKWVVANILCGGVLLLSVLESIYIISWHPLWFQSPIGAHMSNLSIGMKKKQEISLYIEHVLYCHVTAIKFAILCSKKLDVSLTPLECKMQGFMQMTRFIKIPFTIFKWKATDISVNIFTKVWYLSVIHILVEWTRDNHWNWILRM